MSSSDSIAIVGHGRSPEGKGWGAKIDACTVVVRMWDCHWQWTTDYGCKYDYGYFEISPRQWQRFSEHNCRTPTQGWVGGKVKAKSIGVILPAKTTIVPSVRWVELGQLMGGRGKGGRLTLPRGVVAACWALERFRPKHCVLVGFDFTYQGKTLSIEESFPAQYLREPSTGPFKHYVAHSRVYNYHDHAIERPLLVEIARRSGTQLSFAQEVWSGHGRNLRARG